MNDTQLLRYSRHIFLPEIDIAGQEKLLASSVLIIGLGGLGSPVAMYLAASGVGRLILADREKVDLSNLQRQIIHTTQSIDEEKITSAARTLQALNPDTEIILASDLNENNLTEYLAQVDCVVDCSDNFTTRFVINRACVQTKTPLISGAAIQFSGQLCVFDFKHYASPCYQCLYPDDGSQSENRCQDNGVIAPLVGVIGSLQSLETIKLLLGHQTAQQLLQFDAKTLQFRSTTIIADPHCCVCH